MKTLYDTITEARVKAMASFKIEPPDWSLDQDVRRYNNEVEVMHQAMAQAEAMAAADYQKDVSSAPIYQKDALQTPRKGRK